MAPACASAEDAPSNAPGTEEVFATGQANMPKPKIEAKRKCRMKSSLVSKTKYFSVETGMVDGATRVG
jgi:hypothetical protein